MLLYSLPVGPELENGGDATWAEWKASRNSVKRGWSAMPAGQKDSLAACNPVEWDCLVAFAHMSANQGIFFFDMKCPSYLEYFTSRVPSAWEFHL